MASGDGADEQSSCNPLTILDVLKAPKPSDLTRKRSIDSNPPPKGKRRARGEGSREPKTVTPSQRVKEFAGQFLATSAGSLFCTACREELSLKNNIIVSHVASVKHKTGKERLALKEAREIDIANLMKANDEVNHPVGETLPMAQWVYRVKVLKSFLGAAVPLAKLASFQDLLEENMYRLSDSRHMSDLVPLIVAQEQTEIKNELSGRPVSVVFDGTTRLGEALAVVVRFVDRSVTIQQRLIRLQLLAKSMTGEEIATELINSLSVQYSVSSNLVVAMMHDRAACNGVALRTLKIVFPSIVDVAYFGPCWRLVLHSTS